MKRQHHTLSPFLKGSTCNVVKGEGLRAFTLVEILISMTIFSIIMISVMMIYVTATDISKKYDINREMRNNIKSVVEDIAEEVRKNDILWVKSDYIWIYNFSNWSWSRLKVKNWPEYRLVKYNKISLEEYEDLTATEKEWLSPLDNCLDIKDMCRIVKFDNLGVEIWPLSNSKVSFTNLSFNVSWSWAIPKVTLNFTARASIREWVRAELAKKTKIIFQTTISERALKVR